MGNGCVKRQEARNADSQGEGPGETKTVGVVHKVEKLFDRWPVLARCYDRLVIKVAWVFNELQLATCPRVLIVGSRLGEHAPSPSSDPCDGDLAPIHAAGARSNDHSFDRARREPDLALEAPLEQMARDGRQPARVRAADDEEECVEEERNRWVRAWWWNTWRAWGAWRRKRRKRRGWRQRRRVWRRGWKCWRQEWRRLRSDANACDDDDLLNHHNEQEHTRNGAIVGCFAYNDGIVELCEEAVRIVDEFKELLQRRRCLAERYGHFVDKVARVLSRLQLPIVETLCFRVWIERRKAASTPGGSDHNQLAPHHAAGARLEDDLLDGLD
eukprot:4330558-Pleurochrysis_carterae.AAC.2